MPKSVKVLVSSVERTVETEVESGTTGRQLLEEVTKALAINEDWYFGLQYVDVNSVGESQKRWLKLDKKVLSQSIYNSIEPIRANIHVQFYPEDSAEEILEQVTLRHFYYQVKNEVDRRDIFCPSDTSTHLESLNLQVDHGDYNELVVTRREVLEAWRKHAGMHTEDAMREYLKIAQNLETYGMSYHSIRNKKGTDLWLGIDALGLKLYKKENNLEPKLGFSWSEISNIVFNDKKMKMKLTDKGSPDFSFKTESLSSSKEILAHCLGNHELFMARRRPDTSKLALLKERNREERLSRERRTAVREGRGERRKSSNYSSHLRETLAKLDKDQVSGRPNIDPHSGRPNIDPPSGRPNIDPPSYEESKLSYYRSPYQNESEKLTSL